MSRGLPIPTTPSTPCVFPSIEEVRPNGNGYYRVRGTNAYAHRFAYERAYGPIAEGLVIDHLCRNRACWNPDHLEAVTAAINTLRGASAPASNARRETCKEGHPLKAKKNGRRECPTCQLKARVARGGTSGNGPLSQRTHCPHGHPFDEENTRWVKNPDGSIKTRQCRQCRRDADERKRGTTAAQQGRAAA